MSDLNNSNQNKEVAGKSEVISAVDSYYKLMYAAVDAGGKQVGPAEVVAIIEAVKGYVEATQKGDYREAAREASNLAVSTGAGVAAGAAAAAIAVALTGAVAASAIPVVAAVLAGAAAGLVVDKTGIGKGLGSFLYDEFNEPYADPLGKLIDEFGKSFLPLILNTNDFLNGIPDSISDFFNNALRWQPRRDPLTLDLDNDGLETVGTKDGVLFDHDGDGLKTQSGWVKPDDGFLVRDLNGNNVIDNGSELFGDATHKQDGSLAKNGFDALADLDSNKDGKVDIDDVAFASLKVWRDINGDGLTDSGELLTLEQVGIASFNTKETKHSLILKNGNRLADLGSYTRTDGQTAVLGEVGDMADIDLAEDTFHREFADHLAISDEIKALPEMAG